MLSITHHENFLWNSFLNITHIAKSKSQSRTKCKFNSNGKSRSTSYPRSFSCWTEKLLKHVTKDRPKWCVLYYYSPSFFRTWSRKKMVINTSGSLSSIFSSSLRSFLETKTFLNNDLSVFCLMRSCFLDAAQTLLRSNQTTQTCYCFSFVATIFWRKIWKRP